MIKIRYRDPRELAPGLYAAAERHSRGTTVYLLPGLTVVQRRAALRRLRISSRRGCGPQLPAPQLAVALLVHRIRTAAGRAGAVFRSHPAASTVPVMVVSAGAIAFLALSAVSIRVIQPPRGASLPSYAGVAAAGLPANAGAPGGRPRYAGRADPGQAARPAASRRRARGPARTGRPGTGPAGRPGTGRPGTGPARAASQPRAPSGTQAPAGVPAAERPRPGAPTRPPRQARPRPAPRPRRPPALHLALSPALRPVLGPRPRQQRRKPVPRPRRAPARAGPAWTWGRWGSACSSPRPARPLT